MIPLRIELRKTDFDGFSEVQEYRKSIPAVSDYGACSNFVGTMREHNQGDQVVSMYLEHYSGMTEEQLEAIVVKAQNDYEVLAALLLHRIGEVKPGEDIVAIAVWSTHRKDAFAACREIMEALKSTAPFWKKEQLQNEDRWVKNNTPG